VTPDGWSAALAFLFFVAPGIVFDLLSRRREPEADESAFREASRVALSSLVFSLPASAVVVLASTRVHRLTRVAQRIASGDVVLFSADGFIILVVMLAELALACLFAYVAHRVLMRSSRSSDIERISAWKKAFRHDCPAYHEAHVRAKLKSGSVWTGRVVSYTPDFELDNRELVLGPPLSSRGPNGKLTPLEPDFHRVVLTGDQIASLAVEYHRTRTPAENGAARRAELPKAQGGDTNGAGNVDSRGTTPPHAHVQAET
jgi:hypothetical protein